MRRRVLESIQFGLPLVLATWFGLSCTAVKVVTERLVQEPDVEIRNLRIQDLSLREITLVADLAVRNPNSFGVTLAGLHYEVDVGGQSLLVGTKDEPLQIAAKGEGVVSLPFRLGFAKVHRALGAVAGRDSAEYALKIAFRFELPVLGKVRVPLTHKGEIPVLRLPRLQLAGIRLRRLSLSSAELALRISVDNPNPLAFAVERLEYWLDVGEETWLFGVAEQAGRVPVRGTGELELPAALDLVQLGLGVREMLAGQRSFPYRLRGSVWLGTELPFFRAVPLDFDVRGEVQITR